MLSKFNKKSAQKLFIFLFLFLNHLVLHAQGSSAIKPMQTPDDTKSQGLGTSTSLKALPPISRPPLNAPPQEKLPPLPNLPKAAQPAMAVYFYPGLVVNRGGVWQGGDNLLNLSSNISVYFEISKPDNINIAIDEAQLKEKCESIFQNVNIIPKTLAIPGEPPLPFFQFQILIYPVQDGYVASCEGRLFESVSLKRIELDTEMGFQAITWQKLNLMVAPNHKIQQQIQMSVEEIAKSFINVYQAFDKSKKSN